MFNQTIQPRLYTSTGKNFLDYKNHQGSMRGGGGKMMRKGGVSKEGGRTTLGWKDRGLVMGRTFFGETQTRDKGGKLADWGCFL